MTSSTNTKQPGIDDVTEFATELEAVWGSWAPTISPGASQVAFISDRGGAPELYVVSIDSALDESATDDGAVKLPVSQDPVTSVRWSADGRWLACTVATHGGVRTQVWVVRPDGTGLRHVAGSESHHAKLGPWTRRGSQLVVGLAPTSDRHESMCDLVDPETGHRAPLAFGGLVDVLDLSEDERFALLRDGTRGAQFCVVLDRTLDRDHPLLPYPDIGSTSIGMLRPAPAGEPHALVAYLVSDAGQHCTVLLATPVHSTGDRGSMGVIASRQGCELDHVDIDDAGERMVLVWNDSGYSVVEIVTPSMASPQQVAGLPGDVVDNCVVSRDGTYAAFCVQSATTPREIWCLELATLRWLRVTARPAMPRRSLLRPELRQFQAYDGLGLTGWLYRGASAGPVMRAGPALLSFHGGPEAQERPTFNPQHQVMAAAGITVFAPNVRGSSGFGRTFVHADDLHGRNDAIEDVRTSAIYLVESGLADSERIAISGRSYGGYLTLAGLVSYPELFAAGVDICGMSDMLTFYRDTEPWIAAAAVTKYGDPSRDREFLRQISPMTHVDRLRAPLLVVHGEHDTNVPIGEAKQLVAALQERGREVCYLELANEGHEYRLASSRLQLLLAMVKFLGEHL